MFIKRKKIKILKTIKCGFNLFFLSGVFRGPIRATKSEFFNPPPGKKSCIRPCLAYIQLGVNES